MAVALAVLTAGTVLLFTGTGLDLRLARLFHTPGATRPFAAGSVFPWRFFHGIAAVSVSILALGALGALAASYLSPRRRSWHNASTAILLALTLGPGLIVNLGLKNHWGRPRPCHVKEFGGAWAYQDAMTPDHGGKGKSFPCGHSSAGFVLSIFFLLFRKSRPRLAWLLLILSIVYGGALGLGRMAEGGHFASDVVWSALLVFAANLVVYYFILNLPGRASVAHVATAPPRLARGPILAWGALAMCVAVASAFATPYYGDIDSPWTFDRDASAVYAMEFHLPAGDVKLMIDGTDSVQVTGNMEGFGMAGSRLRRGWIQSAGPELPHLNFWAEPDGYFTELALQMTVHIPEKRLAALHVEMAGGQLHVVASEGRPPPRVDIVAPDTRVLLPASWTGSNVSVRSAQPAPHGS